MDRFQRLHAFLETILANPLQDDPGRMISKLQLKLERARPAFLDLLDAPPKVKEQRQQLEQGHFEYLATSTKYPVGQALCKEILFLSDQVNLSENLAASLVSFGINAKPRSGVGRAESGLLVYLDERAALIACLQAIWRGALSADERLVESGIQRVLERETDELTKGKGAQIILDPSTKRRGTFVEKLVESLGRCQAQADELRAKLRQPIGSSSNALTTVNGANAAHGVSFSDETNEMRIQRLDEERRLIGQLLFLVGAGRQISKSEVQQLLRQLSQTPASDNAAVYVLIAVLAALDVSDPAMAEQMYPFFSDASFVAKVNETLAGKWAVPQLKAVVQLSWSTFLDVASRHVPNFETDGGELVDQLCWEAVESGVFAFLGRSVLSYKWDQELQEVWDNVGAGTPVLGDGTPMDAGFADYITEQVELLALDVITSKFGALRKLRNREEDVVSTSHRGGGHRSARSTHDDRPQEVRHDLESFFLLIATIHRGTPDAGLQFWEDSNGESVSGTSSITARLSAFLRWGSESRSPAMIRAFYEMVAALASGPQSATYAFEFLSSTGSTDGSSLQAPSSTFSWAALFGALEFYLNNLPNRPSEAGPNAEGALGEMPPEEVPLLRSFIRLLRQVIVYSDVARATLYDNQRHRPLQTLFGLLSRPVPIELKASLLQAIAAFSRPGGSFGVDVARRTWVALEQSQILPTLAVSEGRDARGGAGLAASRGGVLRGPGPLTPEGGIFTELEEAEAPNKVFPESTAFVELLNMLIHTPSSIEPIRRGVEIDSQTIPDNLGSPHRAPGVDPYIHFVIDDILLKVSSREFADPKERWKVTDVCLAFVEKCLASFDLGPFLAWAAAGGQRATSGASSPFAHLVIHPGFDMLSRLLSASPLLESVLTIVIAGYDAIRNNLAGTPLFTNCMLRCLRILHRTLELQEPFLEVVLPWLAESSVPIPQDKLNRLKNAVPVDQSLLYQSEAVIQIALLISCEEEDEIALLAVQILGTIAESPFFDVVQRFPEQSRMKLNRLVGLLQSSPETLRILDGVVSRLDEDVAESDLELGEWDGPEGEASGSIRQAIRSAILDLLLQNTQPDRAGPNIAHLLLGFNVSSRPEDMEIDDPDAADTQRTSLHVILDLLAQNVSKEVDAQVRHPVLAAKCYRLIRQLCLHKYTSSALSRYLRNRENFFLHQTLALPFDIPSATSGALGVVQFPDGRTVATSSPAVCATLQSEAWLLESAALELSVLAAGNDTRRQVELIAALFENRSNDLVDAESDSMAHEQVVMQQGLPRMLEIFHSFDFSWEDSIHVTEHRLSYFSELRFESCLKTDSNGCEVYDFEALLSLIGAAKRELQNRGILSTQSQQDEAKQETRAIIETLVVDNHRREIQSARYHALRAWRSLLDIALTKTFALLPVEGRHSLLLDLMAAILPPLAAQETDHAIGELLSGAAVLLMTKLRDDGVRVVFVESVDAVQTVSPERLHSVLRSVLQAILHPGVSPVVRGNLYAVLLNYVQYSAQMASLSPALARILTAGSTNGDDSMSLANDDLVSLDGASTIGGGQSRRLSRRNALESGNFAILQSAIDRLLPVICRDAAVGHEVWRTVAFTALDALVMIAAEGRATGKILGVLTKQGYLQSFVASLKDAEADLQETLEPDPASLNALYIYEAEMSFLIRLASTREGAEKLMSADLLARLAQCEYLGARPIEDSNAMTFDGFLPPATERHHQLLLPALQLVVGTLVSFGADTQVAVRQALTFVGGQRENLLIALKDCASVPTMPALREAHLIVTLLSIILPSVSEDDITTPSSFGGLHAALLSLSTRICGPQNWISQVEPSSDAEREDSMHLVLSLRDNGTVFTDKVQELVESLEVAILTYQSVATRKQAGSSAFRAIYTPTTKISENVTAAPSLGSAGAFLHDTARRLSTRLADVTKLTDFLENFESTPLEEIEEALAIPEDDGSDVTDRRSRVLSELKALHVKHRVQVTSSLHLLELALLLYWRHIAFYFDPERAERDGQSSRPEFGVGLAESLRARSSTIPNRVSSYDLPVVKESVSREFQSNIVNSLRSLEFTAKNVGSSWRGREAYVGSVVRKLQDLLLVDE